MPRHLLPALQRRLTRLPAHTFTWLERMHHVVTGKTLIILVGHYYVRDDDGWIDAASVDVSLEYLSHACHVMPLREALSLLEQGRPLPPRAVSLVVDDAAAPFYEMGWPSLRAAGVPFSLGVVPGLIRADTAEHRIARLMYGVTSATDAEQRAMVRRAWSHMGSAPLRDRRPLEALFDGARRLDRDGLDGLVSDLDVPDETYMTWEHLSELRDAGVDLVAHSMSHPRFRYVTGSWLDWELGRSAALIEEQSRQRVDTFVFPYGSTRCVTKTVRSGLMRHGYAFGLVTKPGITTPRSDRFTLPRVNAEVEPDVFERHVDRRTWVFNGRRRTVAVEHPLAPPPWEAAGDAVAGAAPRPVARPGPVPSDH